MIQPGVDREDEFTQAQLKALRNLVLANYASRFLGFAGSEELEPKAVTTAQVESSPIDSVSTQRCCHDSLVSPPSAPSHSPCGDRTQNRRLGGTCLGRVSEETVLPVLPHPQLHLMG